MTWNRFSILVISLIFSTSLFASKDFHSNQLEAIMGVSNVSDSLSHLTTGSDDLIEVDTLHSESANNDFTWGFSYGYNVLPYENKVLKHVIVGLDWIFLNNTDRGDVYQSGYADQNNFTYSFRVQTSRLMLNSELDFQSPWKQIFPYFQMSAGGARAETSYRDIANDPSVGGGIELDNKVNYNFAWSLGAGIKYLVIPTFQISASYLFTDFGVIEAQDEAITQRFYTNSGLIGFTYLFG